MVSLSNPFETESGRRKQLRQESAVGEIGIMWRSVMVVTTMQHLLADESGQDLIEYVLLAAVLGLGTVACLQGLTRSINNVFNDLVGYI